MQFGKPMTKSSTAQPTIPLGIISMQIKPKPGSKPLKPQHEIRRPKGRSETRRLITIICLVNQKKEG